MRINTTVRNKRTSECLKTLAIILLVTCYCVGNISVETFHQLFHAEKIAIHSTEQEKDPCHRTLYHKEKDNGCKHASHVASYKKCPLCENISVNDQLADVYYSSISYVQKPAFNADVQSYGLADISSSLLPRAPPVL